MAKKKVTQKDKPTQNGEKTHQSASPMEEVSEVSEKIENLKSLNSMLLKETVERRQQVDLLEKSNGCLEMELNRFKMEKNELESDLGDFNLMVEIERDLVFVFVDVQVGQQFEVVERERVEFKREKMEMEKQLRVLEDEIVKVVREKSEIEKVKCEKDSKISLLMKELSQVLGEIESQKVVSNLAISERDEIRKELGVQIKESKVVKEKLIGIEKSEKVIREEVEKLREKCKGLTKEKEEKEKKIELIMREKASVEKSVVESNKVIEGLKKKIVEMDREKEAAVVEKDSQMLKISELENALTRVNDAVLNLQKEEERLRGNVAMLEKKFSEGEAKEKELVTEIVALVEETKRNEKSLESLIDEKCLITKKLDEALKQSDKLQSKVEEISKEKSVLVGAKEKGESLIFELKRQVSDLKETIQSLEETSRVEVEKKKRLDSDVGQLRDVVARITAERDEARKGLKQEKSTRMENQDKISEKEKCIEERNKVIEKMKAQKSSLTEEKKQLENRYTVLKKDMALVESKFAETQKELDNMQAKVGLADAKSDIILNLLKNTVTFVSKSEHENGSVNQMKAGEEVKAFVAELDAIKDAFKGRESTVEDMKRQVESLQHSAAAHKRSFWTLLTSATTIFAAASVAYYLHSAMKPKMRWSFK